ncbi:hypothetical protein FDI24_gp229 [Acidovorax phage ACP17]|uniref:Uncharacterized protein n=1 Tax=Acidovorax phage ACP17 TaxID=2010329 RepID=A0A218M376_9CAUD|nr:hypothetical protein FDI24_gp229 [Acidovorax phage ACP17]ASD50510.1 hypothetical protein [Acidovorax phage ACP17]
MSRKTFEKGRLYLVIGGPLNPRFWNIGATVRSVKSLEDGLWLCRHAQEGKKLKGSDEMGFAPMRTSWLIEIAEGGSTAELLGAANGGPGGTGAKVEEAFA